MIQTEPSSTLTFTPLARTFGAEVHGLDFHKPISKDTIAEIRGACNEFGVLVFRNANIDNAQQIEFTAKFGEMYDVKAHMKYGRKMRFPEQPEIFDVSNLDENGNVLTELEPARVGANKGNCLWHADMAYNPRRAHYSILRAVELPPKGTGGATQYLDSRSAYDDLPEELKRQIEPLICNNSLYHNRKMAAPDIYADFEPLDYPMSRHKLAQLHEESGRMNLYVTTYAHHFDGQTIEESAPLLDRLLDHVSQDKYMLTVEWENNGDMVMWDNTAVLHRATPGGAYTTKYVRDMRRTTTKDSSSYGWGADPRETWEAGLQFAKTK
jgi:alpha-ketoglutarate-dependent 2,4-dichlorophenoxyacetate dioxygenase